MKSLFRTIGVVILSLVVTTAFGQQRGQGGMRDMDPEAGAKRSIEQMKEIIKIKDKKEEKAVKEVFIKYAKERQKMFSSMQQGGGDPTERRAKMDEIIKKQNVELKKILGEERFDVYNKKMEEQRANRRRR